MADYVSKYEGQEIDDLLDLVPGKYTKPQTGIPSTDMSAAVQSSLGKADTALQDDALDDYRTSDDQDIIDAGKADKVSGATNGNLAGLDASGNLTDSGKKSSDFATAAQGAKADTALQPAALDDYRTADDQDEIDDALDARIDALSSLGRFLSVWNCVTGLPQTEPSSLPYTYKTGDYYIIGKVGSTNLKPNGSTYDGTASSTVDSGSPKVNDLYRYDGSVWSLLSLDEKEVAWGSIAGTLSNQTDLQNALNAKLSQADITSSLTSSSTNSQAAGAKAVYDGLALKAEKTTSQALTFTAGGENPYTLDAGKIYTLDASTATGAAGESITFSLPASPAVTDIFDVQITIGATAPTINWPASITWAGGSAPTIAASKKYEVNICNNLAVAQEF